MIDQPPLPPTQITGAEAQVQFLLEQIGEQAKQHAAQVSALRVNHAVELQQLRIQLATAQTKTDQDGVPTDG